MTALIESLKDIVTNPYVILIGTTTLIEVAPIKVNPWKWFFTTLGNLLTGELKQEVQALKKEVLETKVQNWRWNVLDFANSCRNGRRHSHDEWRHTMSQLAEYEDYIESHNISNGIFEEDAKYLRDLYQDISKRNDFL